MGLVLSETAEGQLPATRAGAPGGGGFSYLTLRGIAGEPLKVVLLADSIDPREATAAVALERLAYLVGTTIIVGVGSVLALIGLPLTPVWFRVFRAFAITGGLIALMTAIVVSGHGTYSIMGSTLRRNDGYQWSSRRPLCRRRSRGRTTSA